MSEEDLPLSKCELCGDLIEHKQAVGLNRYVLAGVKDAEMISEFNSDKKYAWDQKKGVFSGIYLCWPFCFNLWVNVELVELEAKKSS